MPKTMRERIEAQRAAAIDALTALETLGALDSSRVDLAIAEVEAVAREALDSLAKQTD